MAVGNLRITKDVKAFGTLMYGKAEDHFDAHPVPDYFVVPSGSGLIAGRFMQGGPRMTDRTSELYDVNGGFEGDWRSINWNIAVGQGESKVKNSDSNYYNADLWIPATENGTIDPTRNDNDPALVESLKVSPVREGKSKVTYLDLRVRGEAFNLPAGPVGWAVGGSLWKESLSDQPDPLTQQGLVVGSIQQSAVDASRRAKAAFAEVSVPVLKNLELSGALRYDSYPDGNSKTSPKIAALWTPMRAIGLRASYTESFRMPSLKQLYGAQEQGAGDITGSDCLLIGQPADCDVAFFQVQGSNPNLKPEKGKTYNFGIITDIGPFSGTLDWWRIDKDDAITTPTITSALEQGLTSRDPVLGRLYVYTNLQNVAESKNEGIDADLRLRFPNTAIGTVTFRDAGTYYLKQRTREVGGEWGEFNGTYALPRWRNTLVATTEYGPWEVNMAVRSVGGFADTPNPWTESEPTPSDVRHVSTHDEWDVAAGYSGFKNLKLYGGIKNLMNRMPPFSETNAVNNQYEQVGYAPLYTSRGRFFFMNATYKFK